MDEKKVKEAIELINHCIDILEKCKMVTHANISAIDEDIKAYQVAIGALEKQMPKKVVDKSVVKDNGTVVGYIGRCPCCNEIIDDTTIVCDCAQVLDWSEQTLKGDRNYAKLV